MSNRLPFALLLLVSTLATVAPASGQQSPRRSTAHTRTWVEHYQRAREGPEQTERVSRVVTVGESGELDLGNVSGDITVAAGTGREIRLEATKRVRDRSGEEARRQLALVTVEVAERGSRVEVRTLYRPGERNVHVSVDYDLTVPAGTAVWLKSVSGNVKITGVKGETRAESVSGNVAVASIGRLAAVKSVSGDVEITSASSDGEVTASSVSGNVSATGLKTRSLDLGTVSGNVMLHDVACERANVRSVSGNLDYGGTLARSGRYELKSHSGDVHLALGGNTGFELDASSFSGNVRSDLPITLRSSDEAGGHRRMGRAVRGVYGDGSAILQITTFSGSITLTKR